MIKWKKINTEANARLIECEDQDIQPRLINTGDYAKSLPNSMPIFIEGKLFKKLVLKEIFFLNLMIIHRSILDRMGLV